MTTATNKPLFSGEKFVAGGRRRVRRGGSSAGCGPIHAQQLLELVRIVDDALNSTSLILLFTVGDTELLFPGDAQIENWQYALKLSDRSEQIVKKLETVDVYKVGHHGSLQRDAESAVGHVQKRRKGLEQLMSTKAGKFPGRPGSGTEVPRETLKQALIRGD